MKSKKSQNQRKTQEEKITKSQKKPLGEKITKNKKTCGLHQEDPDLDPIQDHTNGTIKEYQGGTVEGNPH